MRIGKPQRKVNIPIPTTPSHPPKTAPEPAKEPVKEPEKVPAER